MNNTFTTLATTFDAQILAAMDAVLTAGISEARVQIVAAISLLILIVGGLAMMGKMDVGTAALTGVRAVCVSALLQTTTYNYYVRDFFFTDLPNHLAAAVGGPRVTLSSAAQFDQLTAATLNAMSYVLGVATGWSDIGERMIAYAIAGLTIMALFFIFALWLLTRLMLALIILLGPFLIILFLFRATRRFVEQWIGMLIGAVALQLAASIVLRILLLVITDQMRVMQRVAQSGGDVPILISNQAVVLGVCAFAAFIMFVLPSVIAIGSGAAGSSALNTFTNLRNATRTGR